MTSKNDFIKLYCFGCGVQLQNDNPNLPGFVPKRLEKNSQYMCQRCFRLQHYGENNEDITYSADYKKIINNARRERALIVYVVDLFAFECSLIPSVIEEIKDCRVLIIASKRDVIPASIKDDKLKLFIINRFKDYGINPLDVLISSATKNYNIDDIMNRYEELRKRKNVYFFGATSVGKSSLVNALLKSFNNQTMQVISTSPYPGTTLDVIKVPVDENTYIYDTPGILLEDSIFAHVDRKLIKYILPRKEIKPRVYQLKSSQSLLVENICKIDFLEGDKSNFTIYLSNDLNIVRSKLENSEKTFNNMIKNKQFKFIDRKIQNHTDLQRHEFDLPNHDVDIVVSGLLWIKIKGKGQKVCLYTPKGVSVYIRDCKI